jgi:CRISPR system Cascade subunit CasD
VNALGFDLNTPMVSWGTGGNSIVPTMTVPTWSAVVGLIGAALGIARDDAGLTDIANDYALAVRVDRSGVRSADYHTVQSPSASQVRAIRPRTRAQELECIDDLNTTITRREYVHDAKYRMFVVQVVQSPSVAINTIVAALRDPVYPLYAGRRSCVLGRLDAKVVELEDVQTATHWDQRIPLRKSFSMVTERRDLLVGSRSFGVRFECVG